MSHPYKIVSQLTDGCSEKYMKKLIGRTDIEDSLKKMDKLTQEEARMATAQVLKVTHTVEEGVRAVDNKVTVVIEGAQRIFRLPFNKLLIPCWPDGKEARVVMQQAANDVDEIKRWSSHNCLDFGCVGLSHSYREPITAGPSKMACSTRSLDESQHCM